MCTISVTFCRNLALQSGVAVGGGIHVQSTRATFPIALYSIRVHIFLSYHCSNSDLQSGSAELSAGPLLFGPLSTGPLSTGPLPAATLPTIC